MVDNPATPADLIARSLRTLSDQEQTVGATLLGDAWTIITTEVPSVPARITDDTFKALVVQIECAMVLRVLNNPDGKLSEQIDDYTWRRDAAVSTGLLYLADAERGLLGSGDGDSDGAFTIQPAGWRKTKTWTSADTWTVS